MFAMFTKLDRTLSVFFLVKFWWFDLVFSRCHSYSIIVLQITLSKNKASNGEKNVPGLLNENLI